MTTPSGANTLAKIHPKSFSRRPLRQFLLRPQVAKQLSLSLDKVSNGIFADTPILATGGRQYAESSRPMCAQFA